jgi:hypothetical protein
MVHDPIPVAVTTFPDTVQLPETMYDTGSPDVALAVKVRVEPTVTGAIGPKFMVCVCTTVTTSLEVLFEEFVSPATETVATLVTVGAADVETVTVTVIGG